MSHRPIFKRLSSNAALLVMLALQLVFGLQLQAAQAAALPMTESMHMGSAHTSSHGGYSSFGATSAAHAHSTDASTADSAAAPDCHTHSEPHDCCHAGACQCHCVYTPGAIALPALVGIAASVAVPSLATTQFVAPRIDEFLRPPIA